MTVYHGSNRIISHPACPALNSFLDFGSGFYTTISQKRALCCADAAFQRRQKGRRTVSIYRFDERRGFSHGSLLRFEHTDESWLDFVTACRAGTYSGPPCDFVWGPAADDGVCQTLILYESGVITKEQALESLEGRSLPDQIVFCGDQALKYLTFVDITYERAGSQTPADGQTADLMPLLSARVAEQIIKSDFGDRCQDTDEIAAVSALYASEVYALLERADTKLWHLSPLTLCQMYVQERETGKISFPEED